RAAGSAAAAAIRSSSALRQATKRRIGLSGESRRLHQVRGRERVGQRRQNRAAGEDERERNNSTRSVRRGLRRSPSTRQRAPREANPLRSAGSNGRVQPGYRQYWLDRPTITSSSCREPRARSSIAALQQGQQRQQRQQRQQ